MLEAEVNFWDKLFNLAISSGDRGILIIATQYAMKLGRRLTFPFTLFIIDWDNEIPLINENQIPYKPKFMMRLLKVFDTRETSYHRLKEINDVLNLNPFTCLQQQIRPIHLYAFVV